MAEETISQEAPAAQGAAPQEAPQPEVKVVEVKETIVDTSGYDAAITAQEELRQYVPDDQLQAIDARVAELRAAKAQAQTSAAAEELERYRKQDFDDKIKSILPEGIDPSSVRGNTNEERLANAQMVAEVAKSYESKLAEVQKATQTDAPTPEQVAAHGEPMIPGGEMPGGDDVAGLNKAVSEGDVAALLRNPAFRKKYDNIPSGPMPDR